MTVSDRDGDLPLRPSQPPPLDPVQFSALYHRLRDASDWGASDRRGALNNITPAQVLAAVKEVRTGRFVTLSAPIETAVSTDNPDPSRHEMTYPTGGQLEATGLDFALDRISLNVHGNADSHIDALCHVIYDGKLYNGVAADTIRETGPTDLSIEVAHDGIVGRGVLIDIPRLRGIQWLEPGDQVTVEDLLAAEDAQGVRVDQGDLLFVRVGHRRRRIDVGPWDVAQARAGLHPTALEFLAERRIAALGSDSNNDAAPSTTTGVPFPVHVLAITAMGLHLLDYLQFEDLIPICEEEHRWTFMCVIAPLRLPSATGSPVNPIAVL
jgi:kynurenine formamidase